MKHLGHSWYDEVQAEATARINLQEKLRKERELAEVEAEQSEPDDFDDIWSNLAFPQDCSGLHVSNREQV